MEELQTWWEIPAIAHYISIFHRAFRLPQMPVEELETALMTSCTIDGSDSLHQLLAALLSGCYGRQDVQAYNYESFLSETLHQRWELEMNKDNPLKSCEFRKLELREKTEILFDLCMFRFDTDETVDSLKGFTGDELRMDPVGIDGTGATYWNFDDERLYKEMSTDDQNQKKKKKKEDKKKKRKHKNKAAEEVVEEASPSKWSLVCSTVEEWENLIKMMKKNDNRKDKKLAKILKDDFLPLIPGIIDQKAKALKKKLLEMAPKRESGRLARKKDEIAEQQMLMDQLDAEEKAQEAERKKQHEIQRKVEIGLERERRIQQREEEKLAKQRAVEERAMRVLMREQKAYLHANGDSGGSSFEYSSGSSEDDEMWTPNGRTSTVGDSEKPMKKKKRRLKKKESFGPKEYEKLNKILYQLQRNANAWPFLEPVTKEIAPDYEDIIETPMDFTVISSKAHRKVYSSKQQFERDLNLIVDNCVKYNGPANEFSHMALRLKEKFDAMLERSFPPPKPQQEDNQKSDEEEDIQNNTATNNTSKSTNGVSSSTYSLSSQSFGNKKRISRVPQILSPESHQGEPNHKTILSPTDHDLNSASNSLAQSSNQGRSGNTVFGIARSGKLHGQNSSTAGDSDNSQEGGDSSLLKSPVTTPSSPMKSPTHLIKRDKNADISRWLPKQTPKPSQSAFGILERQSLEKKVKETDGALSSKSSPIVWSNGTHSDSGNEGKQTEVKPMVSLLSPRQPFQGLVAQLKRSATDQNRSQAPHKKPLL